MSEIFNELRNDPRSTAELIEIICSTQDEDLRWDSIWMLQARGDKAELAAATELCQSPDPNQRISGINILGQLGIPERTLPRECGDVLLDLLAIESAETVLASLGIALGHLRDPRGVALLAKWKAHPNPGVRMGVVLGLTSQPDALAIATLIELCDDPDLDIRNWATFALASQIDIDTQAIRDALFERAILELGDDETHSEIRGEALLGLATRKDPRVIAPLLEELQSESVGTLTIEAAAAIADPRLRASLIALQDWWDIDPELLESAIDSSVN